MTLRFQTRVFLLSFAHFALLLGGSFLAIQHHIEGPVRGQLRTTLRENQVSEDRLRLTGERANQRSLQLAAENSALKAGLQLIVSNPNSVEAKQTVEDQLVELCESMGFGLLMVSDESGTPLAGVVARPENREGGVQAAAGNAPTNVRSLSGELPHPTTKEPFLFDGTVYRITAVAVNQGVENLGFVMVGEPLDFSAFHTDTILLHDGAVVGSNLRGISHKDASQAVQPCIGLEECQIQIGGREYVSYRLGGAGTGVVRAEARLGKEGPGPGGMELRSLQNLDEASRPLHEVLNRTFLWAGMGSLLATALFSVLAARNIAEPVVKIAARLRNVTEAEPWAEFGEDFSSVREVRELAASLNRAGAAVREGRESLRNAYVEFVGAMAIALDTRDKYTAGHSERVSAFSRSIGQELGLGNEQVAEIGIGALLHDIGKIGVPDAVLRKPGKLTPEEFDAIKQHPDFGYGILRSVHGFAPYLDMVRFHHENWDGSGYPLGLRGEDVPRAARIVHVADAYDAMTSDRPYRRGMAHDEAIRILRASSGSQFDPTIVDAFCRIRLDWKNSSEPRYELLEVA